MRARPAEPAASAIGRERPDPSFRLRGRSPLRQVALLLVLCAAAGGSAAQELIRTRPDRPVPDAAEPRFAPRQAPLPLPSVAVPAPQGPEGGAAPSAPRVRVRRVEVEGSTVFSKAELAEATRPFLGRDLSADDLEALRRAVTLLYVGRGYVNSGALLPDQAVTDGTVRLRVVEGRLTRVDLQGRRWFRDRYLRARIAPDDGAPLNVFSLQRRLQLLQADPRIERLNAELRPGARPGESLLAVDAQERGPYDLRIDVNNYHSPTVGAVGAFVTAGHRNLTGNGDRLSLLWGRTEGLNPQIDASYSLPVTAKDTVIGVRYRRNDSNVVEQPFEPLDVETESEAWEVSVARPFYRSLAQDLRVGLAGERIRDETRLLGERFSFSPGAEDGRSTVAAVRLFQDWSWRSPARVVAAYSRLSLGVDALGATTHSGETPDSLYLAWLGQAQWAELFPSARVQSILRVVGQFANDPLLPAEQIAVGGRYSVRGYRENQLVRDDAVLASFEARVGLVEGRAWADFLQLAPFFDWGRGWNKAGPEPDLKTLASLGLGVRWGVRGRLGPLAPGFQAELYWGHALKDAHTGRHDLQDDGVHFQATLSAF